MIGDGGKASTCSQGQGQFKSETLGENNFALLAQTLNGKQRMTKRLSKISDIAFGIVAQQNYPDCF